MTHEVIVIGGGAMGSAAAWQLARRGHAVTLLERFGPAHTEGASHGALRNFNVAYTEPEYLAMLLESRRLWRELEDESGAHLFEQGGLVDHGPSTRFDAVQAAVTAVGFEAEFLAVPEAQERWPGIRFDSRVLYFADAGTVRADDSVAAFQHAARHHGAEIRHGARVTAITPDDDAVLVEVETAEGRSTLRSRRVIVTVGAWTTALLGGRVALPRLVVTQEQPGHFAARDEGVAWPSFNHRAGTTADYGYWLSPVYGLHTPGEGIKVGWHGAGPVVDPERRDYRARAPQREALQRYARDWLPGVDAGSLVDISCTYTSSEDTDFVIDRSGPVVFGAGFSGHGFKFAPAIGRLLADLAVDDDSTPHRFRSTR